MAKSWWAKLSQRHKIITVAGAIVIAGLVFPLGNPITVQIFFSIYQPIFDSIANPIIADIAPQIGAEALVCIEEQGGTYNFEKLVCEI